MSTKDTEKQIISGDSVAHREEKIDPINPLRPTESVADNEVAQLKKGQKVDYAGAVAKTDPEEIRLVRKLDFRIMPMLWIMYFLNYIDRNAIASARLNGLEKDLGMKGAQFNTTVSILFVGYVLMQVPSNMLITKLRPSLYMSICMMVWAVVSGCAALPKSYAGMVLVRFFLGITEAPFYPGALYLLSIFYTRKEVATRVSILYTGQIVATGVSGLIAAGVFEGLDGVHGIKGWRWLFILEGSATMLVGIVGCFLLPDTPLTTKWLSEHEKQLAHDRIRRDLVNADHTTASAMAGLKQAVRDPKTWLFCLMQNFHLSACSFNSFFPTVVKTLGYSTTITLVLTAPPFLVAGFFSIFYAKSSGHFHERTFHITGGLGLGVVGFIIAATNMTTPGRYTACFIFATGAYSVNSIVIGWASSTLNQTKEKKSVVLAMTNVAGQIGYIYGAYLWPVSDGPRYGIGFGCSAGFAFCSILCAWWIRTLLKRENKRMMANHATAETTNFYAY